MVSGERFTPETAYHMEMTLGLPDDFIDHPNPTLPLDVIRRLRSPLETGRAAYFMNQWKFHRVISLSIIQSTPS